MEGGDLPTSWEEYLKALDRPNRWADDLACRAATKRLKDHLGGRGSTSRHNWSAMARPSSSRMSASRWWCPSFTRISITSGLCPRPVNTSLRNGYNSRPVVTLNMFLEVGGGRLHGPHHWRFLWMLRAIEVGYHHGRPRLELLRWLGQMRSPRSAVTRHLLHEEGVGFLCEPRLELLLRLLRAINIVVATTVGLVQSFSEARSLRPAVTHHVFHEEGVGFLREPCLELLLRLLRAINIGCHHGRPRPELLGSTQPEAGSHTPRVPRGGGRLSSRALSRAATSLVEGDQHWLPPRPASSRARAGTDAQPKACSYTPHVPRGGGWLSSRATSFAEGDQNWLPPRSASSRASSAGTKVKD